jgi:hypothetical protein
MTAATKSEATHAAASAARREADERGDRIERLLDEVQSVAGPVAWPRVEALVTALVDLYGAGLERMLACARDAATSDAELAARLASDELVSSLLVVHGLHPVGVEERVERALARVREQVPSGADVAFDRVEDGGVVHLRVADPSDRRGVPPLAVLARAIELEAPEVTGVTIDDLAPPPDPSLIQASRLVRGGRP